MTQVTEVGLCTIIQGDNLETLRLMPDSSVQCCVTSPPYDKLRSYGGYVFDFEGCAKELYRVMCAGGVVCWVVGDSVVDGSETLTSCKQKIFFAEQCGFRVHDTMIYEKTNFSAPERSRYHQIFEYVFVLAKGAPRVFNPLKDRPNIYAGAHAFGKITKRQVDGTQKALEKGTNAERPITEFGMRMNVWRGITAGQERPCQPLDHPAQMPEWLAGDLILSWSNVGDTVLDICAGGGTTGLMAQRHNRRSILLELNPDYVSLTAARLQKDLEKQNERSTDFVSCVRF